MEQISRHHVKDRDFTTKSGSQAILRRRARLDQRCQSPPNQLQLKDKHCHG